MFLKVSFCFSRVLLVSFSELRADKTLMLMLLNNSFVLFPTDGRNESNDGEACFVGNPHSEGSFEVYICTRGHV